MPQKTIKIKVLEKDSDTSVNWIVYHYELTNDGRHILLFEPNFFNDVSKAIMHCDVLRYLSGQDFYYCRENEISRLDLIVDDLIANKDV